MTEELVQWANTGKPCTYYPDFADKALEIINSYIKAYKPCTKFFGLAQEVMVRHLLYSESIGYNFTPEQRDYYIKTCMGIIPLDKEYERQIGYFGQSDAA